MKRAIKAAERALCVALGLGLAGCMPFGATITEEFVIAERGHEPTCTIAYPTNADACVRYAAEELRDYVKKLTGVELPINGTAKRRIDLDAGNGAGFGISGDGFAIMNEGRAVLVSAKGSRGCLYGVYMLLERFGGVGFYSSWCEKVPRLDRLAVPAGYGFVASPAFEMRQPYWFDVSRNRAFAAKLRVNGYDHTPNDVNAKFGPNDYRFGGGLKSCHTFNMLCDPKVYFDAHPEYFALVDGKRLKERTQLCLTNPDVLEIVTSNVLARIRRDPDAKFYGVSQNDWYNYCECGNCRAVDLEEESHAGTMVRFVNAVAERVEREFPDALVETLAYQYTRKPPKKTRLRHNVVPCLCTIECDFSRPIPESPYPENRAFAEDIAGWAAQTDRLYLWDYTTQFTHYPHAFANVYALQGNIRFFLKSGVKMLFEQGDYNGAHGGFAELKTWLLAKLMWNPDADLKALLDEFFDGYYGAAAPFVREYFEELHRRQLEVSADPKRPLTIFMGTGEPPYDDDAFLAWADGRWEKAEEAVKGTEPFAYNVKMGRFSHLYTVLERLRELRGDEALKADPGVRALAKRLLADRAAARNPLLLCEWAHVEKERLAAWRALAGEESR